MPIALLILKDQAHKDEITSSRVLAQVVDGPLVQLSKGHSPRYLFDKACYWPKAVGIALWQLTTIPAWNGCTLLRLAE